MSSLAIFDATNGEMHDVAKALHNGAITACVYCPLNKYVVTAGNDHKIKIWTVNITRRRTKISQVFTLFGHAKPVTGLAVHPENGLLLSCSLDCSVRVWNVDTFQVGILFLFLFLFKLLLFQHISYLSYYFDISLHSHPHSYLHTYTPYTPHPRWSPGSMC